MVTWGATVGRHHSLSHAAAKAKIEEFKPPAGEASQQILPEEPIPDPPGMFATIGAMGAGGEWGGSLLFVAVNAQ